MDLALISLFLAFWFGILTSISPCPLASNIVAVSFISKELTEVKKTIFASLYYVLGRSIAYISLAALILFSMFSIPILSDFLQEYMNIIIGPILIITGMFLLELITFNKSSSLKSSKIKEILKSSGIWGAGLLGLLFAFSFCPISAALFFGSLIPLSIKHNSFFVLPLLYGIGTGIPVVIFAIMITLGVQKITLYFKKVSQIEKWARIITGSIFIIIGIYYCFTYLII